MHFIQQETIKQRNIRNIVGGNLGARKSNDNDVYPIASNGGGVTLNNGNSNNMIEVSDDSESDTDSDIDSDTSSEVDTDSESDNELNIKTIQFSQNKLSGDEVENVPTHTDIETMFQTIHKPIEITELADNIESVNVNVSSSDSELSNGSSIGSSIGHSSINGVDITNTTTTELSTESSELNKVTTDTLSDEIMTKNPTTNTTTTTTTPYVQLNYTKMLVKDLRQIVKNKGLSSNTSKMKKQELIQLLQQ
jgi:hypothetical protein